MSNLSNKEKEQLQNAVERITDYCVDGMSPNNAIIKTAKEMRLTPDRLPVLVNAYNAGATAEHWNSYDSVREKTASFPIADLDVIHKTLYPQTVKKASKRSIAAHDEDFALSPEVLFGENLLDCYKGHLPAMQKSAAYSSRERHKTNTETHDAMRAAERQSTEDVAMAMMDAEACLTKLAKVVNYHGMPDFESLKKTAAMVYGQDGLNVMAYIEETYPKSVHFTKTATALRKDHPFYSLMTEAIKLTKKVAKAQVVEEKVHTKCAAMKNEMDERWRSVVHGDPIHRLLLTPAGVNKAAAEIEKKNLTKQALREEYDVPHHTTLLDQLNHPEWNGATEREYGILHALADPNQDARLRNIQTETIFTDLINTDDFLSKQDPEAVLEAYNDILEVSPNLRGKKMLLRQALREYMASESLDLSTIAQLQKMDATEQSKYDAKRKERTDSAQRFAESEQKQRQEDAKLEQKERQMRQEVEQKELDRRHQLELERRRIASSEAEGERSRRSTEGIERSKLRHAYGMEHIRNQNAISLENLRDQHATGLENLRDQHATSLENLRDQHATGLENLRDQHATGLENLRDQHATTAANNDREFQKAMAIAQAEQRAQEKAQERADAQSAAQAAFGQWLAEHGKDVLDDATRLSNELNTRYTELTNPPTRNGVPGRRMTARERDAVIRERINAINNMGGGLYRVVTTMVDDKSRRKFKRDANGKIEYQVKRDRNGQPILDASGKLQYIKDKHGNKLPELARDPATGRPLYMQTPYYTVVPNEKVFPQEQSSGSSTIPQVLDFGNLTSSSRRVQSVPFQNAAPVNPVASPSAGMTVPPTPFATVKATWP